MNTVDTNTRGPVGGLQAPWLPIDAYALALTQSAEWKSAGAGLEQRDLQLGAASKGRMVARHLRTARGPATLDRALADEGTHFHLFYVMKGVLKLQSGTQEPMVLGPGDCIHQPALAQRHRAELSDGCELLELAVPLQPMLGSSSFDLETSKRAATPVLTHDRPESYKQGDGPRKYFQYRDLGVAEATDGRIHIHIIRATGPAQPGGTGWHRHTMCQLFYVFTGSAVLEVEPHDALRMYAGDAMCISAGTRHNVPDFSSDYSLLEVCIPADYDTVDTGAPGAR